MCSNPLCTKENLIYNHIPHITGEEEECKKHIPHITGSVGFHWRRSIMTRVPRTTHHMGRSYKVRCGVLFRGPWRVMLPAVLLLFTLLPRLSRVVAGVTLVSGVV